MRGYSLVDLTVTLSIAALLVGVGLPGMVDLVKEYQATRAINNLVGQIQLARSVAITQRTAVTLCPTGGVNWSNPDVAPRCGLRDSWHSGSMLFMDGNGNGRFEAEDRLVHLLPPMSGDGVIRWRAFRNRSGLTILASGLTDSQNGSFRYCPANNDVRFARQAILNRQARVRHARDSDGDGVREAPNGKPLSCPP